MPRREMKKEYTKKKENEAKKENAKKKETATKKENTKKKENITGKPTEAGKVSWKPGNMLFPVPAVMVSCKRGNEKANIVTVAWAGTVCSDPAMVSISVRPSRFSHDIIKESGEFVVNLVNKELTRDCDWCGVKSGKDHDKFAERKLTPFESEFMKAPAISESPVNIYCKVKKSMALGSHTMFLGEVVGVTVDEKYLDEKGRLKLEEAGLIAYSHGEYVALGKKLGSFGYSVRKKKSRK